METTDRNEFDTFPLFSLGIGTWVTNTTGLVSPANPPVLAVATEVTALIASANSRLRTIWKQFRRTITDRWNVAVGTKGAFISNAKASQVPFVRTIPTSRRKRSTSFPHTACA